MNGLKMGPKNTLPPPTDRQVELGKALVVLFGAFGIIALAVGIWTMLAGGSDSLEVLYPGGVLCGFALLYYFLGPKRRRVFRRSSATAEAKVVDRKRRKVRAGLFDNISSGGGCALAALLEILLFIVDLFLIILERAGLRERKYRYVDHKLILEFQAMKPGIGTTPMTIEIKVNEEIYEATPPGSVVGIRYSMDNPNQAELFEEAE